MNRTPHNTNARADYGNNLSIHLTNKLVPTKHVSQTYPLHPRIPMAAPGVMRLHCPYLGLQPHANEAFIIQQKEGKRERSLVFGAGPVQRFGLLGARPQHTETHRTSGHGSETVWDHLEIQKAVPDMPLATATHPPRHEAASLLHVPCGISSDYRTKSGAIGARCFGR